MLKQYKDKNYILFIMSITMNRAFLQQQYITSQQEKKQKVFEYKIEFIKSKVLIENEKGRTSYTDLPDSYEPEYLNNLIRKLQELFVDCDVIVNHQEKMDKPNIFGYRGKRSTTIKIDWTPLDKKDQ